MSRTKIKKETKMGRCKKRFFRPQNPLLRVADTIIQKLDGTTEEMLGQFEMIVQSENFQKRYPDLLAFIVRQKLR